MIICKKQILLSTILILSSVLIISCSSDSESSGESSTTTEDEGGIVTSRIANTGKTYTIADFEAVGLKKPKSLKADAVDKKTGEPITPKATEAHLGFFKSSMGPKDIELRFYETHQDALESGAPVAEKTISITHEAGGAVKGAGTFAKSSYGAYIVTGNVVMLCQVQIEVCDELISELK